MDDDDNKPPRGILFVLEDGTSWAEMTEMKVLGLDDEPEVLSDAFANVIIPATDTLH
jgi:hypothetical protein